MISFFIFPPQSTTDRESAAFDHILTKVGLTKATEKDAMGTVVTHLGFELDSQNMEVRLPYNKKLRALNAVQILATMSSVSHTALEEALGFLSHCCQVVPLGRPFLRRLFSFLRRNTKRRFLRIRIPAAAKNDIKWWLYFLSSWSSVSIIRLFRTNHDVATDASGVKGIGGIHNGRLFSERVPSRHREKHINWKEMFAILHAFVLWHKDWAGGRVRLACDNSAVVQALSKNSIKGETIRPLQTILLIAAVFDIEILIFWIPSEENIIADAASRHDYEKLANLGFQVSSFRNRTPSRFQDIDLAPAAIYLLDNALAPATRKNYDSARSSYESLCRHFGYTPFPASIKTITHWLAEVMRKAKPATAKGYLKALRSTHVEKGLATIVFNDPRIELVIRGGKGVYGEGDKKLRLPLTAPILCKVVNEIRDDYDGINLKAALCVAFAGFLRSGESTWDNSARDIPPAASHLVLNRMVPSLLPSLPPKPIHFDTECSFNSHPHLPPQSALSLPSKSCLLNSPMLRQIPCFLDRSVPSHDNTWFQKSKNCSSEPASHTGFLRPFPTKRSRQSLLQLLASPARISSSFSDLKATLSTSISTKSVKLNELKKTPTRLPTPSLYTPTIAPVAPAVLRPHNYAVRTTIQPLGM